MIHTPFTKSLAGVALSVGLLLLIPLVAMQFTDEVSWDVADFAAAGALLFGAGLAYVLAARRANRTSQRVAAAAIFSALAIVWAELAVGILS